MFPVAFALIGVGYVIMYYGGSMARAEKIVHKYDLDPTAKGGIPFGMLLGVVRAPVINKDLKQATPPIPTGTEHHRP